MKRYYISDIDGFREVSKEEYEAFGQMMKEVKNYAAMVVGGEITMQDVPETHKKYVARRIEPSTQDKAKAYDILTGGGDA